MNGLYLIIRKNSKRAKKNCSKLGSNLKYHSRDRGMNEWMNEWMIYLMSKTWEVFTQSSEPEAHVKNARQTNQCCRSQSLLLLPSPPLKKKPPLSGKWVAVYRVNLNWVKCIKVTFKSMKRKRLTQWMQNKLYHKHHPWKVEGYINGKKDVIYECWRLALSRNWST